jgi:hypothetical protein
MSQSDSAMRIEPPTKLDVYKEAFWAACLVLVFVFFMSRSFFSGSLAPCLPVYLRV